MSEIQPFSYSDETNTLELRVTPRYSILKVNEVEYYFTKDTGEFDGTGWEVYNGPVLVS